ncbi:glycine--tRNA ligase [Fervidicoccus sp.]|uniref:glycine--tRNA ligase n=1 Tax=Fervidicoccus sp. TaxID=2060324 RepID=UPI003D11E905
MSLPDKIFEIGKRRGFFWQSYEIYGGVAGFYDLGPYGILLKNNIICEWKRHFILPHQEMIVEIEAPIIGPEAVYKASGHIESFTDPIVSCTSCHRIYRADHLIEEKLGVKAEGKSPKELTEIIRNNDLRCPYCGGVLGEVSLFNLLFKTQIGPYTGDVGYFRPELAQGMFLSFKRVFTTMRERLPLGIAQIGRVGRNEISPRQGMLRLREFTIMEIEFFFDPEDPGAEDALKKVYDKKLRILTEDAKRMGEREPKIFTIKEALETGLIKTPWLAYWMYVSQEFLYSLGIPYENQYFEEKLPEERAHYSKQTFDQLVKTERWGWIEVSGHAYRGDYDLSRHSIYSKEDLSIFKQYQTPHIEKSLKIMINKAAVGKAFKSESEDVISALNSLDPKELKETLEKNGFITIKGKKITKEMVNMVEEEEKITGKRFIPHVVEPSFGVERLLYVVMEYSLKQKEDRYILSLKPSLSPVKVAVFPLVNDEKIEALAKSIYESLKMSGFTALYDDSGSIGRRYARADEIGVPFAVTVDYQSLEDSTITIRFRDTWEQKRLKIDELTEALKNLLEAKNIYSEIK